MRGFSRWSTARRSSLSTTSSTPAWWLTAAAWVRSVWPSMTRVTSTMWESVGAAVLLDRELDERVAPVVEDAARGAAACARRTPGRVSGTSMFFPLTIVLTLTSREAPAPRSRGLGLSGGGATGRPAVVRVYTRAGAGVPCRRGAASCGGSALARHGDRGHAERPGLEERLGAGRERRAGRDDVVDEHDPAAARAGWPRRVAAAAAAQAERARDVGRPLGAVEVELGDRRPGPLEDRRARAGRASRPATRGDQLRLVVAAPAGRSAWTGTGTSTSPPAPARRQRRAIASPERHGEPRARRRTSARAARAGRGRRTARTTRAGAAAPARPTAARSGRPAGSSSRASSAGQAAGADRRRPPPAARAARREGQIEARGPRSPRPSQDDDRRHRARDRRLDSRASRG